MHRAASRIPAFRDRTRQALAAATALAVAVVAVGFGIGGADPARAADPELLSQGKTATASSGNAALAFDGKTNTRWESASSDPQWIQVDLGKTSTVSEFVLRWETARSKDYVIEVSEDGSSWTTVHTTTNAPAGNNTVESFAPDGGSAEGRFVRLTGTSRTTGYGHSLWEFEVRGSIAVSSPATPTGKTVEVVGTYGDWQLYVGGAPYTVKGLTWGPKTTGSGAISAAKLDAYMNELVSLGVNTIRTWGTDADSQVLFDAAAAHGIRVIAGFWIQPGGGPGSGGCPDFVAGTDSYLDAVRSDVATFVEKYKNHDAVLMWSIGNESLLGLGNCYTGSQLEDQRNAYAAFVEELAQDAKAIDANHPVTSTDAWVGAWPYLKNNAPSLDLYAINSYGAISGVQQAWEDGGYTVPYVVTETGPQGEWETPADATGKPSEPSDAAKAQAYLDAWTEITSNAGVALGATMFHFGTETDFGGVWFNLYPGEKKRAAWYAVAQAYGGPAAADDKAPTITAVTAPTTSVVGGSTFEIAATVADPESDPVTVSIQQSGNYATGSGALAPATAVAKGTGVWTVTAPQDAGVWKFYVTATDDHGNIAYAPVSVAVADAAGVNVALGKAATASSSQDPAANAVDGSTGTKWGSALDGNWHGKDAEWFQVDLGATYRVNQAKLLWEGQAFGKDYDLQVSVNGTDWTTVSQQRGKSAGTHTVAFAETEARYVRMSGIARGDVYGYSLYEFQVFSPDGLAVGSQVVCGRDLVNAGGVTASASHGAGKDAIDNNVWARWDSGVVETPAGSGNYVGRDGEWLQVDLGRVTSVCGIKPYWEAAFAADYDVLVSTDGQNWATAAQVRGVSEAGPQVSRFEPVSARYVKIVSVTRGTQFGISMWDLEIFEPRTMLMPTTELLGDRVVVFDPSMDALDIQAVMDSVFADQEKDQFGAGRWQFFFTPGEYAVDARVGFYTSLSGAGLNPTDVDIHGADWVDAEWFGMNATQNFWRSAENLSYTPDGGLGRWAVSQAAPFRRVQVNGDLQLDSGRYGWSSGGFMADTKITGFAKSFTQQQWYTRDSSVGTWAGGVWNFTYSGVEGKWAKGDGTNDAKVSILDAGDDWPKPPVTALEHTGAVAEKPFLYLSGSDADLESDWSVFVPAVREGTTGTTWEDGTDAADGSSVPLSTFFIVKAGATATEVNAALAAGKNLLFTPGVYEMDKTIEVTRPGTIVLGLGLATIIPTGDGFGMHVADAAGVRVAGLLFDAAVTESPALLVVGDKDVHTDHAADPIVVNDVFLRVGGAVAGKVKAAMIVNADDTIVDHVWSWRGDHGDGIGWNLNTSDYGFVVNGDDVSAYGLFVEHYQKYNTLWKGENGRTIFYQNELAYDVPDEETWTHDGIRGWVSYKVDAGVKKHEAWGLGSYSNFTSDTEEDEITVDNGFEVPKNVPGVKMHSLLTVSLGGEGIFEHVINGVGARQADSATVPSYVAEYPIPGDEDAGIDPAPAPKDPATNPETSPKTGEPGTGEPGTGEPGTGEPGTGEPGTGEPGTGEPGTGEPGTGEPGTVGDVVVELSAGSVVQGGSVRVDAAGLPTGATVEVWLHSEPKLLATVTANGAGEISTSVKIPADTAVGAHTLVVTVPATGEQGVASLQVTAAGGLPATGVEIGATVTLALLLLAGGVTLFLLRRRKALAGE